MIKILNIIKKKINIVSKSYSYDMIKNNLNFIIKKILEESIEFYIIYIDYLNYKNCYNKYKMIKELCDIIYHIILIIIYNNIKFSEIYKELIRRLYTTGMSEKKFRI